MKSTKLFSLAALIAAFCFASCGQMNKTNDNTAVMEKNKATMKKVFEMFESGNPEGIENYVSENQVDHTPDPNIKSTGIQAMKDAIAMYHTAYPDMKMTVYSMVAEGDQVIAHFNLKGTNSGPIGNMPATNKMLIVDGVDIVRFADGKGVEHWGYWEEMKMMQQLGMMPDMNTMNKENMQMGDQTKMEDKDKMEKK